MGFKLKYDSSNVDRSKADVEPPSPGVYRMKISEAKYEKKDTGDRIVFVLRMQVADSEGKGKGYGFWDYVKVDIDWKIDQYLQAALGIDTEKKKKGQVDIESFVGKEVLGRVKSDTYDGEYRPKLASVMPLREDEDDEDDEDDLDDEDTEEIEDDDSEEEDDEDEDEDEDEDSEDVEFEDEDEDEEDEDEEDDEEGDDEEEEEEEPPAKKPSSKKSPAKEAAPPAKGKAPKKPKYEDMSDEELTKELKSRKLPSKGTRAAQIARLRKHDSDPFS